MTLRKNPQAQATAILGGLIIAAFFLICPVKAATIYWPVTQGNGALVPLAQVALTPISAPNTNGLGGFATGDKMYYQTDTNSLCTLTNLYVGYYKAEVSGPYKVTPVTFVVTNQNQTNFIAEVSAIPTNNLSASTIYTVAASDARFAKLNGTLNSQPQQTISNTWLLEAGTNTVLTTNQVTGLPKINVTAIAGASSNVTAVAGELTATPGGGNVAMGLANAGTAGTYQSVTTDSKGRVTSGGSLTGAMIPVNSNQLGVDGAGALDIINGAKITNLVVTTNLTVDAKKSGAGIAAYFTNSVNADNFVRIGRQGMDGYIQATSSGYTFAQFPGGGTPGTFTMNFATGVFGSAVGFNTSGGTYTGDGGGLTGILDAALSGNVALLNGSQTFSGTVGFAAVNVSGLITGGAWKGPGTNTSSTNFSGSLSGDVTGTQSATVVNHLTGPSTMSSTLTGTFIGPGTNTFSTNSTTAVNFSGSLSGDVTGTQSATVVALVNGSTAANVHAAELLANAATSANTASAIVKRDGSGNFTAGTITGTHSGDGSALTSLNGTQVTTGTVADARLSANVALQNGNNNFSAWNNFSFASNTFGGASDFRTTLTNRGETIIGASSATTTYTATSSTGGFVGNGASLTNGLASFPAVTNYTHVDGTTNWMPDLNGAPVILYLNMTNSTAITEITNGPGGNGAGGAKLCIHFRPTGATNQNLLITNTFLFGGQTNIISSVNNNFKTIICTNGQVTTVWLTCLSSMANPATSNVLCSIGETGP